MRYVNRIVLVMVLVTLVLGTTACKDAPKKIIIAEQYGLAYAPIQVMREKGYLEVALGEEYTIEWVQLSNTEAIREAMIAGQLDIGFLGIPPFLIGVDNGMNWQIMTGLSVSPLGLVTNNQAIRSLEDLLDAGKIALPQPGSIQHILLSMEAEKQMNQATIFDNQLISMKHPDGQMALASDSGVVGHFTSPPYLFMEEDLAENHVILTGEEAFGGEFTFIVGVCAPALYENTQVYEGFLAALEKGREDIINQEAEVLSYLQDTYQLEAIVLEDYLYQRGISFESKVLGVQRFADFMFEQGYIKAKIEENDVMFDEK